jgi:hypothetical protein
MIDAIDSLLASMVLCAAFGCLTVATIVLVGLNLWVMFSD